jgi:hypothetical protein
MYFAHYVTITMGIMLTHVPPALYSSAVFMKTSAVPHDCSGVSILELLVVVLILAIFVTMGTAIDFKPLRNPLVTDSANLASFLKMVRSKAIGTTSAMRIQAESITTIKVIRGTTCDTINIEADADYRFTLSPGVLLLDQEWSTCFTSRGLANENIEIPIGHQGASRRIEIMLGGGSRIS